jgi:hypothetical protein
MTNDDFWDEVVKIGLVLGSIWLGSEIIKSLSKEDKKGGNNGAGTQPPN